VRDDLGERHEGERQPGDVPVRAAAAVIVLGAALGAAVLLSGFGGDAKSEQVARPIVLVSGRDDHGLLVQKTVALSRLPGGEATSRVPDGTLVRVEATHGEWLQVRALERTAARGWVNDFYLRGTAHLTRRVRPFPRGAQVEMLAVDGPRVRVRSLETKQVAWVPRRLLRELPATSA
jgi:hypothetical protein